MSFSLCIFYIIYNSVINTLFKHYCNKELESFVQLIYHWCGVNFLSEHRGSPDAEACSNFSSKINKFHLLFYYMAWPKGRKHTKEEIKKISKFTSRYYSNPLARKKMSTLKKKQYQERPELITEIDRTVTKWWREHPHIKKERSETLKKLFIEHPDKFKKFLKYGSNPILPHFKTKQKFLVRSRGEQTIANFLHDNNLVAQYESKTLIFKEEGQICVPDFYLPKYKMYIEFYGGHPKSWKKKVMKNKLYKKHKIPCIFITPAELRNLGKKFWSFI